MEKIKKMFLISLNDSILRYDCFLLQCSENRCVANVLDKSSHDYELELLKKEKEEALAEEVKTTKAGKSYWSRRFCLTLNISCIPALINGPCSL